MQIYHLLKYNLLFFNFAYVLDYDLFVVIYVILIFFSMLHSHELNSELVTCLSSFKTFK